MRNEDQRPFLIKNISGFDLVYTINYFTFVLKSRL